MNPLNASQSTVCGLAWKRYSRQKQLHDRIEAELALKAGAVGRAFIEIIAQSSVCHVAPKTRSRPGSVPAHGCRDRRHRGSLDEGATCDHFFLPSCLMSMRLHTRPSARKG